MNAGKAIYYLLANNATVSAITTRIFPEVAPQDADAPFIVYRLTSVSPDDTHDGPAVIDEVRFDVICVSETYDQAADMGSAARVALDRVYGTYSGVNVESIQFDDVNVYVRDQPRQYGQELTFIVRVKRDAVQIATGSQIEALNLWRLADVDDEITDAIDRQALVYDEATSQWIADGVGQVVIPVRNNSRDTNIEIGTVIKAVGTQGDRILVDPFNPDLDDTKFLVGIASEQLGFTDLTANGHAQVYGELRAIDTDAFNLGDILYPQSDGTLGTTENVYPVAIVTRKQENTGRIFIRMWTPGKGYHQRYRTEADAELISGVELYYTATADGDGYTTQDLTAAVSEGNEEQRRLYYKAEAFGDSSTASGYTDAGLATDATYAEMLVAFNNLLKTNGAPITIYATRAEVASRTGLLDEYGGAAAAYSVRELSPQSYTGYAMQIERASDNTTQDIGWDENGDLDTAAISTFCSGTTCRVRIFYDQSGNGNDATQTTFANQPTIYTGGAVVTENGRAALDLDDGDGYTVSSMIGASSDKFAFLVHSADPTDTSWSLYAEQASGAVLPLAESGSTSTTLFSSQYVSMSLYKDAILANPSGTTRDDLYNLYTSAGQSLSTIDFAGVGVQILFNRGGGRNYTGTAQELVFYASDQSTNRSGIETNINDYFDIYTPFTTGLLDTYSGAAAAYSLRRLSSTYTGDAIRVRRASDNAEQDIGFDIEGNLNTAALASFCSGTNGFVKTWFDQSSNTNDATQTTTANQPKIYDSATGVITENGKPAIESNGTTTKLTNFTVSLTGNYLITLVSKLNSAGSNMWLGTTTGSGYFRAVDTGTSVTIRHNGETGGGDFSVSVGTAQLLHTAQRVSTTMHYAQNSSDNTTAERATQGATFDVSCLFDGYNNQYEIDGTMQEVIIYPSDQSSNRTGIESNINTHYSIYTP